MPDAESSAKRSVVKLTLGQPYSQMTPLRFITFAILCWSLEQWFRGYYPRPARFRSLLDEAIESSPVPQWKDPKSSSYLLPRKNF